ncbi:protein kinase [Actinomadura sp. 21ATH]|uniref:protein kinase domain-containing protein n=1 Tax=Actinomadura sp. 21ATH TaxID=1735444 RepID=UPI0035BFD1E1
MEPLRRSDPRMIGRYRLLGQLGSGAMGQVYLGRSPGGRPVAVKVIHPWVVAGSTFRARFRREVEAARRVGGFHTAQVVDVDAEAESPWIVSAYVPGPSLRDAVNEHGPLPAASVLTLGAGIAEGLSAVHACGLVHRDLKPGNVLIAADGPRILDFGIAHLADASTLTASGAVIGTPAYMSPEQARGDDGLGPASDVFSLGAVLAFAATGRSPFAANSIAAAVYRILHREPDLTGLPHPLRGLVTECLAKEPADRPDVAELIERLSADAGNDDWLPTPVIEMVTERSLTAPDAASTARDPVTPPRSETPQAPQPPRADAGPTIPDTADAGAAKPRRAAMNTPGDRSSARQAAVSPPSTGDSVPPAGARRHARSGGPSRRKWLIPVSVSAAVALLATAGAVATTFWPESQANQPDQAATAGPTRAVTTTATPPAPRSTPTTPKPRSASPKRSVRASIPPGYVVGRAFAARLAVPSGYLADQLDGYRYMFKAPPGQQKTQIIQIFVCSHEDSSDAPKGAAARARYWTRFFGSARGVHDPKIHVGDATVNGRAAKVLTMIFRDDDNHVRGKQEMYYSGSEGEWKIVIDYRLESYNDEIDQSPFRTAITTFRV